MDGNLTHVVTGRDIGYWSIGAFHSLSLRLYIKFLVHVPFLFLVNDKFQYSSKFIDSSLLGWFYFTW